MDSDEDNGSSIKGLTCKTINDINTSSIEFPSLASEAQEKYLYRCQDAWGLV